MGLVDKILGLEEPRIPIHQLTALLAEQERGRLTGAQALAAINAELGAAGPLTPAEETKLAALAARVTSAQIESVSLGATVVLTNVGAAYDSISAARGLGFLRFQGAGVTGIDWLARWEKIGTGTLSFQLWDETAGVERAVFNDAGAAGVKEQSIQITFPALAAGLRTLRVRAKSTVAADDPIYHGSSLLIRRLDRLSPLEVHEILMLASSQTQGYATVAAVEARLGI